MRIGELRLRQRDGRTCGPSVAVVAGALLDPSYRSKLSGRDASSWFSDEQSRVHARVNRLWPRMLGTTPMGLARAISAHSGKAAYRWRLWRGRRDPLTDVLGAVRSGRPVAMLIGSVIPRHWVLVIEVTGDRLRCYEPSSGEVRTVQVDAVQRAQLTGLGYPRPFAFALPRSVTRSATA